MIDWLVAIVFSILSLGMVVWAVIFFTGKGYKSIAGNSDTSKEELREQRKQGLGIGVGIILLLAALMTAIPAVMSISRLV